MRIDLSQGASEKPKREISDIQSEYSVLAAKAGQTQYQIFILSKDLEQFHENMRDLNLEAAALKGSENA